MKQVLQEAKDLSSRESELFTGWAPEAIAIWARDEGRCIYCGFSFFDSRPLEYSRPLAYYFSTIDHLLPKSKFAYHANSIWNKVLACRSCNRLKGAFCPICDNVGPCNPAVEKDRHIPNESDFWPTDAQCSLWISRSIKKINGIASLKPFFSSQVDELRKIAR